MSRLRANLPAYFAYRFLVLLCQFAPASLYVGHGREADKAAEDGRGAVRGLSGGNHGGGGGWSAGLTAPGSPEAFGLGSRRQSGRPNLGMIARLGLSGRDVSDRLEKALRV